jgi:membrane protein YqaA with SNARE-associated domain
MFDWLHAIADWTLDFADSGAAVVALALVALSESVFFPVPPDPLLIAIGIRQPEAAIWLAALCTVASVAGGVIGRWLGIRYGRPLLLRVAPADKVDAAERMYRRYGAWAVIASAITPIPFKVFTVLSGVMDMELRGFLVAALIGRGIRFMTVGVLIALYGDSVEELIRERFEYVTIGAVVAGLALVAALLAVRHVRRRSVASDSGLSEKD